MTDAEPGSTTPKRQIRCRERHPRKECVDKYGRNVRKSVHFVAKMRSRDFCPNRAFSAKVHREHPAHGIFANEDILEANHTYSEEYKTKTLAPKFFGSNAWIAPLPILPSWPGTDRRAA
ncbi:hypothetical protein [Kaistia terrae]|uniref:Uncharacterized protein n=1 Tax=Kaistia terrae TaxID=537017 RepID=A0ABW0PX10_9HYPH|nr:hypothetical protein [Kaistia terrae]MCX5576699.1 hypothetical protein [Kaistia terrae]